MKFAYVQTEFWAHARRHKWDEQTRTLGLYLLTSPHRHTEGLFHLPLAYAAHDLQYPIDTVSNALSILLRDGFVEYDFAAEIILLVNALRYDIPKGSKRIASAVSRLKDLPTTPLLPQFIKLAEQYSPDYAKALHQEFSGVTETVCHTLPDTLSDTVPDTPSIPYAIPFAGARLKPQPQPQPQPLATKTKTQEGGVGGDKPSDSTKTSTRRSVAEKLEAEFDEIWAVYPRKTDRLAALKAYKARRRERVTAEDLAAATANYAKVRSGEDPQFTKRGATFFGPSHPWRDYLPGGPGLIEARQSEAADKDQVSEASQAWRAYRRFIADQSVYELCDFPDDRMKFAAYETYGNWREMCECAGRERNEDKAVFLKAWDEFEAVNV